MAARRNRILTDREEIQRWVEDRGGRPARVGLTGGGQDIGIVRLDFPDMPYSEDESLEETSWDDWFNRFEGSGLALVVQDTTAGGTPSTFHKLVSRDAAGGRGRARRAAGGRRGRGTTTARRPRAGGRRKTGTAGRGRGRVGAGRGARRGTRGTPRAGARGGRTGARKRTARRGRTATRGR
jgi:hypothetical protein